MTNTSSRRTHFRVLEVDVSVEFKDIKNLHLSVYPPDGKVHVAAPQRLDEDTVRRAVINRLAWIRKQQKQLREANRQTVRHMVTGETHWVWGQRYRLDTSKTSGTNKIRIQGDRLYLITKPDVSEEERFDVLDRWYRRELKKRLTPLVAKWSAKLGIDEPRVVVRKMRTKWGSCKPEGNLVTINPELAKKDPRHLDYIVLHELAHFHERTHNEHFAALMDTHMHDWRTRAQELDSSPLAAEDWPALPNGDSRTIKDNSIPQNAKPYS